MLNIAFIGIIVLIVAAFIVAEIHKAKVEKFYHNPVGGRCRYYFNDKWIKGVVEWNNSDYYYITPDERLQAFDLVHRRNVKPIIWKVW